MSSNKPSPSSARNSACFLGIDIGGTGIKAALVNPHTGELLSERYRLPTPDEGHPDDVLQTINQLLQLIEEIEKDDVLLPIGVTFPGVIGQGKTLTAANVHSDWIGLDATTFLTEGLGREVFLLNDADAAGLAEVRLGHSGDSTTETPTEGLDGHTILLLTFGTGIGSALIHNGILIPNTELGHLYIKGKHAENLAAARVKEEKDLSWKEWTKRVNRYLAHVERLFSLDVIIIGGGVSKHADRWLPLLQTRARVVPSVFRNNAGIIGAAVYAYECSQRTSSGKKHKTATPKKANKK